MMRNHVGWVINLNGYKMVKNFSIQQSCEFFPNLKQKNVGKLRENGESIAVAKKPITSNS
jgi:hypothetical protein